MSDSLPINFEQILHLMHKAVARGHSRQRAALVYCCLLRGSCARPTYYKVSMPKANHALKPTPFISCVQSTQPELINTEFQLSTCIIYCITVEQHRTVIVLVHLV